MAILFSAPDYYTQGEEACQRLFALILRDYRPFFGENARFPSPFLSFSAALS